MLLLLSLCCFFLLSLRYDLNVKILGSMCAALWHFHRDNVKISSDHFEEVDTISLSDAVQEDVWLMKFDVEGCECHCLKSAEVLFAKRTVNYVFIETDRAASANCGCNPSVFVDFFNRHGE